MAGSNSKAPPFSSFRSCASVCATSARAKNSLSTLGVTTYALLAKETELMKEFDVVLEQEELFWFQKSREKWINMGDRNSRFFHTSTIIRRRRNHIDSLKDDEGKWISDPQVLEKLAIEFFTRLYSVNDVDAVVDCLPSVGFPRLTQEDCLWLSKSITTEDIEKAVQSMGSFKSPGPDGYQPKFYHKCWDIFGDSVVRFVLGFFDTGYLPPYTNDALLVLIAKDQMGFLRGHPVNSRLFRNLGASDITVRFGAIYEFVMERLCHMIDLAEVDKKLKPISLSRGGPKLSHICFADSLILFAEASVAQIRVIRGVLEKFCIASGQKFSLEKSKILFSNNVSRDLEKLISDESGIKSTRDLGKYLGMHILHKRMYKDTFGSILERVSSRLSRWKSQVLSFTGRLTLTKVVLSSIPIHSILTIILPQATLACFDKVSRSFLWGSTPDKRKQHLVAWDKVCLPKCEGGLGIRAAKDMNKALIAKMGWRLINDQDKLWARVVKSNYKVGHIQDTTWTGVKSNSPSTWRSVGAGLREVIGPGHSWVIGDGRIIRFWVNRWLSADTLVGNGLDNVLPVNEVVLARDLWIEGVGWDMSWIAMYIPEYKILELMSVVVDNFTGAQDRLSWGLTSDGKFTVCSAYQMLIQNDDPRPIMSAFLVGYGAYKYQKRSIVDTILHVLRDCPAMYGRTQAVCPWSITFAMIVWWGWKWRCDNIFGEQGLATAGGVLRSETGEWRGGFALNIGCCSAPMAELWGVNYGSSGDSDVEEELLVHGASSVVHCTCRRGHQIEIKGVCGEEKLPQDNTGKSSTGGVALRLEEGSSWRGMRKIRRLDLNGWRRRRFFHGWWFDGGGLPPERQG
ncbi:PREDICTED: uncharacterized protein LOC109128707 [Camelina sativa]|uniref:Uncharacterized protein LOC109128707 n=1 Tax=Camelina sativa TaxID=90675 RepID=A0ABM1QWF9_CAMSA|nr:PREDICTED: uncharacterized protein LOC109128707 [Camelina sativa]